jgi:ribosome-binding factor A
MAFKRIDRLRDQIKEVVAEIIQRKLKDTHVGFVTVTDVKLTADLSEATVYYSVYGDTLTQKETNRALDHAKGFIQSELARQISIRKVPTLSFKVDRSVEHGLRIEELLNQIHEEDDRRKDDTE